MIRVVFVCMGNICRSPQAEGIFRHLVAREGLDHRFDIDSAGTGAWHVGELADPRTRAASRRHGIELTSMARQFVVDDFQRFDHIVAMDRRNLAHLQQMAPTEADRARVRLLRTYDLLADDLDVPDPYYGEGDGFEKVFQICWKGCEGLLTSIKSAL